MKKPKRKTNRELQESWEAAKARMMALNFDIRVTPPKGAAKAKRDRDHAVDTLLTFGPTSNREGATTFKTLKSRTGEVGGGTVKPSVQYTGDKMLGIATMHKSSSVPVFSSDEAKAISKMRR